MLRRASAQLLAYCAGHDIRITRALGWGKDGTVFETDRLAAVKQHDREEGYRRERDVYLRLRELAVRDVLGHQVPRLLYFDDARRVLELSIVMPPFILDFASAFLDEPPDFPEEVVTAWHEEVAERFPTRAADVFSILDTLAARTGIYVFDVHPDNIKFG